jgi:hypothetical protein
MSGYAKFKAANPNLFSTAVENGLTLNKGSNAAPAKTAEERKAAREAFKKANPNLFKRATEGGRRRSRRARSQRKKQSRRRKH